MFGIDIGAGALIDKIGGAIGKGLDKWIPDAKDRLEAEQFIAKNVQAVVMSQIEVNKTEAAHNSLWVAGWRPFIGWVCGSTLAYVWIVRDMLVYAINLAGSTIPPPPLIMQDAVMELTIGMLGLGAMRTYEKVNGATKTAG